MEAAGAGWAAQFALVAVRCVGANVRKPLFPGLRRNGVECASQSAITVIKIEPLRKAYQTMFEKICCTLLCALLLAGACEASFAMKMLKRIPYFQNLNDSKFASSFRLPCFINLDDMGLKTAFNNLSNGCPDMDCGTFSSALNRLRLGIGSCEMKELFLDMDGNHDGHISYEVTLHFSCKRVA